MKNILLFLAASMLGACTTLAGPFVTNISHDGEGHLTVDKCNVTYNAFLATVGNSNCTSSVVKVR